MQSLSTLIRGARLKKDLNQDEVERLTGIDRSLISKIEGGNRTARPEELVELIKVLGLNESDAWESFAFTVGSNGAIKAASRMAEQRKIAVAINILRAIPAS